MTQARSFFNHHGGRVDDARAAFPNAPLPWLDLSTGINPRSWTPPPTMTLDHGPLPGIAALRDLEHAAARFFGCDAARVAAVPGSEIALRLLGAIDLPRPLTAVHPSYGTHRDVADHVVRSDAIEQAVGSRGSLLVANPNNPDGRLRSGADLFRLSDRARAVGGFLIVDEAFADVDPAISLAVHLGRLPNVLLLRSFGKFFGLAGVRLGFVVASPEIIARVRGSLGDWPVSTLAIAWGTAAYRDTAWIAETRAWLRAQAERLDRILARHGLSAQGACPLFRLVAHHDAPKLFQRLAGYGILTRPFADEPDWLRFGLPADAAALDRLDQALAGG